MNYKKRPSPVGKNAENILPGLKPVLELLEAEPQRVDHVFLKKGKAGPESARILDRCREAGVKFSLVPDEALEKLCQGRHQGVAARLRQTPRLDLSELLTLAFDAPLPLVVALDEVQDPGNVGTLARTLYALGGAGLVTTKHNSAYLGPGARKSSAGALDRLPLAEVVNLGRSVREAEAAGFHTYAARMGERSFDPVRRDSPALQFPALLVLGNEDKGVRQGVACQCQESLAIPQLREFDSLNVAQAGAILISCFLRDRESSR